MYKVHDIGINKKGSISSYCHKLTSAIVFIYNCSIGLHQSIYATNINTQVMIEPSQYIEFIQYNNTILFSFTSNHITVFIHIFERSLYLQRVMNSCFLISVIMIWRCSPLGSKVALNDLIKLWSSFNLIRLLGLLACL